MKMCPGSVLIASRGSIVYRHIASASDATDDVAGALNIGMPRGSSGLGRNSICVNGWFAGSCKPS